MAEFKIGVMVDSFKVGFEKGLEKAREAGAQGIQVYATNGEMAPENLTKAQIAEKKRLIEANGLEVAALCGDFGGHGFARKEDNAWKVKKSKQIVDLALELGTRVVTTHIGVVPEDKNCVRYETMQEACYELGSYAGSRGAYFAIETGPEKAQTLRAFLDDTNVKGLGVNLDPANFVMVTGDDPVRAVETLGQYIVHTHAKDGVRLKATDPRIIYDFFAEGGIGDMRIEDYFREVPLGEGGVDFDSYLKALEKVGYHGYLTIEREVGENPEADIRAAVAFLRGRIG